MYFDFIIVCNAVTTFFSRARSAVDTPDVDPLIPSFQSPGFCINVASVQSCEKAESDAINITRKQKTCFIMGKVIFCGARYERLVDFK